jgi:transcription elongation factor GreA
MSNFLTQDGLDEMIARRKQILQELLPQITIDINNARDQGDLKENAGFQTAIKVRDELTAELDQLDEVLNSPYEIINANAGNSNTVTIGKTVKLLFLNNNKEVVYTIVGSSESNILEGKISNQSPLAEAIINKKIGETVEFNSPNGPAKVKILETIK